MRLVHRWIFLTIVLGVRSGLGAEDMPMPHWAEAVTPVVKKSLVTIRQGGRTGGEEGVGSGFVVGEDGLIATNLHVIGEGRSITVELPDGTKRTPTGIHAWDRTMDLAIVRVDGGRLPALPLGHAAELNDGEPAIALGAPQGLKDSVVEGIVSAQREIDEFPGVKMLQIAMPIEPGNSGGPVVDSHGHVLGIVTLRSVRTPNLGFAMPVTVLQRLLEKPNPVPMERWQTIGALDPRRWQASSARWSQRAGLLRAEGRGAGFGGRALCLWQQNPPGETYEVETRVKLDDESGAAGLVFAAQDFDRHYGFYPTNGGLRLMRFEGNDVFTWTILQDVQSPFYRPGEWNDLRVRVEPEKIVCYLNGNKVIESDDKELRGGRTGLCKFRETEPEFARFRMAADLSGQERPGGEGESEFFLRQAKTLEENARRLRDLADRAHLRRIERDLGAAVDDGEGRSPDIVRAALEIARLDQPELDVEGYRDRVRQLAEEFAASLGAEKDRMKPREKLDRLNEFFFRQNGFHGARFDYSNQANSHLNEVLDDREGIPISLCVLYMEVGRGAGLRLEGLPRPGQFAVRCVPGDGEGDPIGIDVFDGGKPLADYSVKTLKGASPREIATRMLSNLKNFAIEDRKSGRALRYAELIVALNPEDAHERLSRALLAFQEKRWDQAKADVGWLIERQLPEIDVERLQELQAAIEKQR